MTETRALSAEIDAAVEQVVKASGDRDALTEAVRALAGMLGYELVAPPILHGAEGGSARRIGGSVVWVAPCGAYSPTMATTTVYDAINCQDCLHALSDADGHDAELGGPA